MCPYRARRSRYSPDVAESRLTDVQINAALNQLRQFSIDAQRRSDRNGGWKIAPGSQLQGDDRRTAPLQTSHLAQSALMPAVDHLHAFFASTLDEAAIHPIAPASLARGALECASSAIWLLLPKDRTERVCRSLRWAAQDIRDADSAYKEMGLEIDPPKSVRIEQVKALAEAAGIASVNALKPITSTAVVKAADGHVKDPRAMSAIHGMWKLASGYAHGRRWAPMAFSMREERDSGDAETVNLRFTLDSERVLAFGSVAQAAVSAALDLYDLRATSYHQRRKR